MPRSVANNRGCVRLSVMPCARYSAAVGSGTAKYNHSFFSGVVAKCPIGMAVKRMSCAFRCWRGSGGKGCVNRSACLGVAVGA